MNKILALALVLGVASCGAAAPSFADETHELPTFNVYFLRDPETGCEYIAHRNGGITPRLNEFRQPICRKKEDEK